MSVFPAARRDGQGLLPGFSEPLCFDSDANELLFDNVEAEKKFNREPSEPRDVLLVASLREPKQGTVIIDSTQGRIYLLLGCQVPIFQPLATYLMGVFIRHALLFSGFFASLM